MRTSVTISNRRVRTRTHGGVAGVSGQPLPLCRSNEQPGSNASRISTEKRYDSIGSAPAGVVGVGAALIPGHFRLGRLNQAAGGCGGRGPSMGVESSFCFEVGRDWLPAR
jgi:hypothetical protein